MALKKNKEQENVFNLSFVINCEHKNMTETDKIEHRLKTVPIVCTDNRFCAIHNS